ncbi:MAG: multifunctional CCA addition/repair protein [Xanthomonadaceae bacterium]|nr:multifunctional CCA addition/repair protein [Xanthomonadaceae bacterium]
MKIYLVGGAVRDRLLGKTPGDRDWVVVGATPEQMLAQGYKAVGRDFPVFLHPDTGEEYALARTERKSGHGYRGFAVHAAPEVTLEEDLSRRDFTFNAMAEDEDGRLIDPYGGAGDLQARRLRHVGPAFVEDPLRVLRAARLMARFEPLGFTVAGETMALMRDMADSGELRTLTPERVWQELRRALESVRPAAFLRTLRACGALSQVLPEIDALYGVPQSAAHHPEVDTGRHQELVSDMAARLAPRDSLIGFAALTHDLGKALTPRDQWPRHTGHEAAGVAPIQQLCARLKVPVDYRQLATIVCREHLHVHRLAEMRSATIHDLLIRLDAFRKPQRVAQIALVCEADKRGRQDCENNDYPQGSALRRLHAAAAAITMRDIDHAAISGPAIGAALRRARIAAIQKLRESEET